MNHDIRPKCVSGIGDGRRSGRSGPFEVQSRFSRPPSPFERGTKLVKYDAACRALADARSIDEVKDIRDKAVAIKAYAKQAKNKSLEADAFEIRVRAERRLGEMMKAQPKAKPGNPNWVSKKPDSTATLAEAGIDKNLANRARQLSALPAKAFEQMVEDGREDVRRSAERSVLSKVSRQEKHQTIITKAILQLGNAGPFPLIYADPPWKWGHFGEMDQENEAGKGRTPDQHYPTLTYDQIKGFRVAGKHISEIAHNKAVLFMWCTSANMKMALEVMEAWGFTYKAQAVWIKDRTGLGLVFRNRHEVLLYGTRGNMPGPQYQPPSVFEYPRGRHSAKPPEVRKAIERMYPDFSAETRLELFARENMKDWTCCGNEVTPQLNCLGQRDQAQRTLGGGQTKNEAMVNVDPWRRTHAPPPSTTTRWAALPNNRVI